MRHKAPSRWLPILAAAIALALSMARADDGSWPVATREQKPWTRWWWPGSAVDRENLSRQLGEFAAIGLGGVEITPIYGARGYDSCFIKFLSPGYVSMLAYTVSEAHRLDLGVDMATCTGWPFGGPWVAPADAEQEIAIADGRLAPSPPASRVKRSAPGDEGPVVNPFSPAAAARYPEPFTAALSHLPPAPYTLSSMTPTNTPQAGPRGGPQRFLAMHGYDLRDHIAELGGQGDPETVARLKADYRETLGQLHLEYIRTWVNWSHSVGSLAREQAHGAPGNLLDIYAAADVPETEIFGSTPFPIPLYRDLPLDRRRHPASACQPDGLLAAHVGNHPLASSETFTWLREHFHESLSEAKPSLTSSSSPGSTGSITMETPIPRPTRRGRDGSSMRRRRRTPATPSGTSLPGSTPTLRAARRSCRRARPTTTCLSTGRFMTFGTTPRAG